MGKLTDRLIEASPGVWLDDTAYAERLLAGGESPWLDSGEYISFRRKTAALLKSVVITIPAGHMASAWLNLHPDLREAMGQKKRTIVALRTLLADTSFRTQLSRLAQGLQACFPGTPFVLSMPSPRRWVIEAYREAHGTDTDPEVGEDETDSGAVYIADFLREFADVKIAGILLEESAESAPQSADEIGWYQPVLNVAEHYRWDIGIRQDSGFAFSIEASSISFAVAAETTQDTVSGITVSEDFWNGAPPPDVPRNGFIFAEIPVDGKPEKMLERIDDLHAAK